jgi:tRNA-dihydrouridine synthase B
MTFLHPLAIGGVTLGNNLALAPLSGTSDRSYRLLCHEYGAGLVVTELVSARGICHDTRLTRNWRYLAIDPAEKPVAIQLFGADPADFRQAIARIGEHPLLGQCDLIDLNMGCPVAKVVRDGAGAALMRTPTLAAKIVSASVEAAAAFAKPVTVKFRKGWDEHSVNAAEFARICEDAGASALTIHGRTREQLYGGQADWQVIGEVKAAVKIPVFGNGDVSSAETARGLLLATGADGVMIGRAAQGRPWLFQEIAAGLAWLDAALADGRIEPHLTAPRAHLPRYSEPSAEQKAAAVLRHLDGLIDLLGETSAVREMRKQLAFYIKGTPHAAGLKNRAMQVENRRDVVAILADWCMNGPKSCGNSSWNL